jgi:predicted PurR-regulated permease PerM
VVAVAETLKRKTFLVNTAYIFVLFGLYYLFMRYAFWVLFPFLLAFLVAVVLQRPINFLVRKTKLKKGLASGLCVLALVLSFLGVLSLVGVKIAVEIKGLIATLSALLEDIPALLTTAETSILGIIHYLPDAFEESAAASVTDFLNA